MDNKQLTRLMGLARKTGSPLIVTDPKGEEPMVIMGVDQYEVMMGVDSFNAEEFDEGVHSGAYKDVLEDDDDESKRASESPEDQPMPGLDAIDEILNEEGQDDDDLGEERFYLEPVE